MKSSLVYKEYEITIEYDNHYNVQAYICIINISRIVAIDDDWFLVFNATFSDIIDMATHFSGGRSRSTWRDPPTMGKQLVNFITCGYVSSAPFFCNLQNRAWTHAVLVIGLYELLGNPTTYHIEPPGPFVAIELERERELGYITTTGKIKTHLKDYFFSPNNERYDIC